jgi:hypothetical protein
MTPAPIGSLGMTEQLVQQSIRVPRLKAVFHDAPLNVNDVSDFLHNLQAFVDVSVAISPSEVGPTEFRLHNAIVRTHVQLQLVRINYNSPLEVVFWVGTSNMTLAAAVDRVLAVMTKWEEWKLKRMAAQEAKDDLALKKLKNQFMRAQYEEILSSSSDQGFPESNAKTKATQKRIQSADRFLEKIDSLGLDE